MEARLVGHIPATSPRWDFLPAAERDREMAQALWTQAEFAAQEVPYWSGLDVPDHCPTYDELIASLPALLKSQIRSAHPAAFLPRGRLSGEIHLHRGTGGSTGLPTSVFYTRRDWDHAIEAIARMLRDTTEKMTRPLVAFNNYNQGHVSGPAFDDTIRRLSGLALCRNFGSNDDAALKQILSIRPNVIIAPPTSTHKGGTFEALLEADARSGADYLNGENIDLLIFSSTNPSPALLDEIRDLGIKNVFNFYGSTDVLPVAGSCGMDPMRLHLLEGHIHAAVVDAEQHRVPSGEFGLIVAGRVATLEDHQLGPSRSSAYLAFHLGDRGRVNVGCTCGRQTPWISDIERVLDVEEKLANGCQVW